ncbi:MAG: ankyrin repeat domain-containing protein [Cocleimonas sp.]|nr:ankyrin repeat domain-containing protein [Cocleimonas sp.]
MIPNTLFPLKFATLSLLSLTIISCHSANTQSSTKPKEGKQSVQMSSNASNTATVNVANSPASRSDNSLPTWRRPASHSLTRGAKDAIFPAAKNGNLTLVKELLGEGVDVNYRNFNGETILHIAASRGDLMMVKYLVSKGAKVTAMTGKKWRPIHHAMRFEHPQVANYLLLHKASVVAKTSDGLTALELAKASKKSGIQDIIKRYSR